MTPLLLSRTLDPADYDALGEALVFVDHETINLAGQHPHRRWEYALALHAIQRWRDAGGIDLDDALLYDVGGFGSPLYQLLAGFTGGEISLIDPRAADSGPLANWVTGGTSLAHILTCVSVIEHVDDLPAFVYHLTCLLAPGGLLVLTMDYWNRCGPDMAARADERRRIFCPKTYTKLRQEFAALQLTPFGGVDLTYHGAQVDDYTFASLVLEKRRA